MARYLVTVVYKIPVSANDDEQAIEGFLRLTPEEYEEYGTRQMYVAPLLPVLTTEAKDT